MANEKRYSQIAGTHRPQPPTVPSFAPPRYSQLTFEDDVAVASEVGTLRSESPANRRNSSSLPTLGQYSFSLLTKDQPWVTLNMQTRPSVTIQKNPRFFGDDNISGTIDLNLAKSQVINSISLVLKGRIATSTAGISVGPFTFLEEHHLVWAKSHGDPRSQTPTRGFDGKLSGNYQFPFSFPFPIHVDLSSSLSSKGKNSTQNSLVCSTPPTILEKSLCANVDYQLVLKITHGLLRLDSKLKTAVTYVPRIIPPQPSPLRQNAYLEGTLLPGPDRDPDGWVTLPSVVVCGKLQIAQFPMDVKCTVSLSLASPLSYTRGAVIPCYLTLSSQNTKALDLLADHKLQNVKLTRTVEFFEDSLKGVNQFSQGKEHRSVKDTTEVGLAVWWVPPKDVIQDTYVRQLQGEIHLSSKLLPSSDFLPLSISYAVQILPFDTDIFEYTSNLNKDSDDVSGCVLQSYPVVIATIIGKGPIPTAFTKQIAPREQKFNDDPDKVIKYSSGHGFQGRAFGGILPNF